MADDPRSTFEYILSCLDKVRRSGDDRAMARCPAHEDKTPSLSIRLTHDKVLLHDFAGCTPEAVCGAVGIEARELFAPDPDRWTPDPNQPRRPPKAKQERAGGGEDADGGGEDDYTKYAKDFIAAGEILAMAPAHEDPIPEDILPNLAAFNEVSLLAGAPKMGKSTWARNLIARATHRRRIFVWTEETAGQSRREYRRRGANPETLSLMYFRRLPQGVPPSVFRDLFAWNVDAFEPDLVVIDPWRRLLSKAHPKGVEGEDSSGVVDDVIGWLTGIGPAVFIVHHILKGANFDEIKKRAGDPFDAIRGSGGLHATVDRAALLFSPDGDRRNPQRTIVRTSREERDWSDLTLQYDRDTNTYTVDPRGPAVRPSGGGGGGRPPSEPFTAETVGYIMKSAGGGAWVPKSKIIPNGGGRAWADKGNVLAAMVADGALEQRKIPRQNGVTSYVYRLPIHTSAAEVEDASTTLPIDPTIHASGTLPPPAEDTSGPREDTSGPREDTSNTLPIGFPIPPVGGGKAQPFNTAAAVAQIPEWLHQRPAMDEVTDDLPLVPGDTIRLSNGKLANVLTAEDWRAIHFPTRDGWERRTAS